MCIYSARGTHLLARASSVLPQVPGIPNVFHCVTPSAARDQSATRGPVFHVQGGTNMRVGSLSQIPNKYIFGNRFLKGKYPRCFQNSLVVSPSCSPRPKCDPRSNIPIRGGHQSAGGGPFCTNLSVDQILGQPNSMFRSPV
jgi:hypothetical protein